MERRWVWRKVQHLWFVNEDLNIIPFEVLSGLKIRVWIKEG